MNDKKPIKIGVVEDEGIIAENIFSILENIGYEVSEPCDSYDEAIDMIRSFTPDLLLLDVHIKGDKSGIDVAKTVRREHDIPFIFLTSYSDSDTIEKAKILNPAAYLVKPFNKEDLFTSIELALTNHDYVKKLSEASLPTALKDSIYVKDKDRFYRLKFNEILYLESDHVYIDIVTQDRKFTVRGSMDEYLNKLPSDCFFRSHRSFIVNLNHFQSLNHSNIEIAGNQVPISKSNREELLKHINQ